jgi:hypothetical protein
VTGLRPAIVTLIASTTLAQPCDHVPTFDDTLSPTTEIHVATTGNDHTGDRTPDNPDASNTSPPAAPDPIPDSLCRPARCGYPEPRRAAGAHRGVPP